MSRSLKSLGVKVGIKGLKQNIKWVVKFFTAQNTMYFFGVQALPPLYHGKDMEEESTRLFID